MTVNTIMNNRTNRRNSSDRKFQLPKEVVNDRVLEVEAESESLRMVKTTLSNLSFQIPNGMGLQSGEGKVPIFALR